MLLVEPNWQDSLQIINLLIIINLCKKYILFYRNNDKSCDESGNNTNSKKKKSKNTSPDQKLNESVYDESKCENK